MNERLIDIPESAKGTNLADYLTKIGVLVKMDCGRRGICGKCAVRLTKGMLDGVTPDKDGMVLACKAVCSDSGAQIAVPHISCSGLESFSEDLHTDNEPKLSGFGVALDIGTTTIAACLVDLQNGAIIQSRSCLNPQCSFGADVMSRISACKCGKLDELCGVVRKCSAELISGLSGNVDCKVCKLVVSGNPTMLHIFCGVSPVSMGAYPFKPEFNDMKILSGKEVGIAIEEVYILPFPSAFIGGDITAGILFAEMLDSHKTTMLLDLGTNGEIVLCRNNKLFAASASAGPALEGAGISCGIGAVPGAVCAVSMQNGTLEIKTINGEKCIGICGSGLIDLIACLLEIGAIDESGYMEDNFYIDGYKNIYLTPKDVRAFQLAKGALRAGLDTLLHLNEIDYSDIDRLYIAGGLGYYLNAENAAKTGIIPTELVQKVYPLGNSSLGGAVKCLIDNSGFEKINKISEKCETVVLSESEFFQNRFIEKMSF